MKLFSRVKDSMFCQLYNLKDEYSTGRAMILIGQMLFAVGNIFISGTFYTAFLMESGIDIVQVSILSIIPNVCWLFGLFAPKVFAKIKRRRGILLFNHLFYYTCMVLLPNLIPVFVEDTGARTVCFAVLLIVGTLIDSFGIPLKDKIYWLMGFLTLISWSGTARLVRGQILTLREQEYMVAAEAMGYSTGRKIFKHLIPNVLPQLIVSVTLSLGSMILYEASLSYLGLGAPDDYAAWGTMINIVAEDSVILENYFNVWGPPGICIVIAVLGFNFIGDGLRDALDPKMRR